MKHVVPYTDSQASKREQISEMFDSISPKYDLLNRVLSMGIDKGWRKEVIRLLKKTNPQKVLDVATGTADLAIASARAGVPIVIGVDISEGMLSFGRGKVAKLGLGKQVTLEYGDSERLRFADASFDVVTVAFGVRNFENLVKGLKEIHRVLKPGGLFIVLEFSKPRSFPFKQLYHFYSHYVLPIIGRLISRDARAYTYLPESVSEFPFGENFMRILDEAGFNNTTCRPLTLGIASIYTGRK
jgi:demethylmenaquinone methyltransferase / 2-methoxy-6-polyprenyl-1,4-benzoquinol methylase